MKQLLHSGPVRLKKASRGSITARIAIRPLPPALIAIAVGLIFPLSPRIRSLLRQTSMRSAAQQLAAHRPLNSFFVADDVDLVVEHLFFANSNFRCQVEKPDLV